MFMIGLCGGSGSGKNEVQAAFSEKGVFCVDTDLVYHTLTDEKTELTEAIADRFGRDILKEDGSLNRRALAQKLFFSDHSENDLSILNGLTHPAVLAQCRKMLLQAEKEGFRYGLINAPLLLESGFGKECNVTIAVLASDSVRIRRIAMRDRISENEAKKRIASQLSDEYLKAHTDYQIENNGTLEQMRAKVASLCRILLTEGK